MPRELVEGTDGLGLVGEDRHARGTERCSHARLRDRHRDRLAGRSGELGGVAREGLDVVAHARHGDRGVASHDRQDRAQQAIIGEQRRRDVDGIADGGEAREHRGELALGLFRKRCQRHAEVGGDVRRHHAGGAGIADRDQAAALRPPALEVELRGIDEIRHVLRPPDAVAPEEGIDHAILVGERARVRARGSLPGRGATGLEGDHGDPAAARGLRDLGERRRVGDRFEIKQQQTDRGILEHGARELGRGHVGVIAGGVRVAHADAARAQEAIGHHAHRAALAHDRDWPVFRRRLQEHGGEARDRTGAEIGEALRVGTDESHARGARRSDHCVLLGPAGRAGLAEARSHDDRHFDPALGAGRHRHHRRLAGHRHDHEVRSLRQAREIGIALVPLDLRAVRIDRINRASGAPITATDRGARAARNVDGDVMRGFVTWTEVGGHKDRGRRTQLRHSEAAAGRRASLMWTGR